MFIFKTMWLQEKRNMKGSFFSALKWTHFVSRRFSRVDRTGRSAVTSVLATLGIGFGVMTLIVVMSIMNGFQMSFIDSILEVSSYHVRVNNLSEDTENQFVSSCDENKNIVFAAPFYEAQALMTSERVGANSVLIRAVDEEYKYEDAGFGREVKMVMGRFSFPDEESIILGSGLASTLKVHLGDEVNLLMMSGGDDVELFSSDRKFVVTGIFATGYGEINNSYAFVSTDSAKKYFGENAKKTWGLKLRKHTDDLKVLHFLKKTFPEAKVSSWREYNKSFFGTLKIEKNMLLLLVALIFVVVAINIYNGMRRLVFERKNEIAILSALGGKSESIKFIFVLRGLTTGLIGAVFGFVFGLIISFNTDIVFMAAAKILYFFQYIFTAITNHQNLMYVTENSTYNLYASIPARVFPAEVVAISVFGVLSPLLASWAASKNVLKMTVSEVLHNE